MKSVYTKVNTRYMNLLTDFGFHKIFGEESNKDLLLDFLNRIIKDEGLITSVQLLPSEQFGDFETDRKAVFDIFCETEKGEYIIVEMQKAQQPFFFERCIFYASRVIQKQAPKGVWDFNFNKVYLIAILDFKLYDDLEADKEFFVERMKLYNERTKTASSDKLEFAFIELPKFNKTEEELKTGFDIWLFILKNMHSLKACPVSIQGEIFDKLFDLAELKKLTKDEMEKYNKSVSEYYDVQLCMNFAAKKGIEQGIEKGRQEGFEESKTAIIKKSIQMNLPLNVIIELTGYTEEQILRIKNMMSN